MNKNDMIKAFIKNLIKKSPIALSQNHQYDIQTKKIIKDLGANFNSIDVGCHKGEIFDILLKYGRNGFHYGVEALPHLYQDLQKKYSTTANCKIFNFAANSTNGTIEFNHVITNPSYSGIIKRDYDKANEKDEIIKVDSKKLDDQIPENMRIDLIKIDVEGGELQVMQGAKNIIKKNRPIIIFEHGLGGSNYYGTTPKKIYDFMQEANLQVSNLSNYIERKKPLSLASFELQFKEQKHYYFVAHP